MYCCNRVTHKLGPNRFIEHPKEYLTKWNRDSLRFRIGDRMEANSHYVHAKVTTLDSPYSDEFEGRIHPHQMLVDTEEVEKLNLSPSTALIDAIWDHGMQVRG